MKFRKKPVVIEAIQLTWSNWNKICDFVPKPWFDRGVYLDDKGQVLWFDRGVYLDDKGQVFPEGKTSDKMGLLINTLESNLITGSLLATEGDWIIQGVKGEFYPCNPDIFVATYDKVES